MFRTRTAYIDGRPACTPCWAKAKTRRVIEGLLGSVGYGFESPNSAARKALSEAVLRGDPRARELTREAMARVERR